MVYCGRPSESCAPCRAKKRRCDKARPACSQCRRAGTNCSGYRSAEDIANPFRDETQPVVAKFKSTRKQALRKSSVAAFHTEQSHPGPVVSTDIALHANQLAIAVFYSRVASTDMGLETYGQDLIREIEFRSTEDSPLRPIMLALGLCAVAEDKRCSRIKTLSTNRYAQAISLTNRALFKSSQAVKDDTLMTVNLLALYETLTATTAQQFRSWAAHIDGATSLLRLRGIQQFHTRGGVVMFLHLRSRIIRACIERGRLVPQDLLELSNESKPYQTPDELKATESSEMAAQFCALRYSMAAGSLSAPDDIVEALLALEEAQAEWFHNLPDRFHGHRVYVTPGEHLFGGHYVVYATRTVHIAVDNGRLMRLMVNQDLRKYLPLCVRLDDIARRQSQVERTKVELCENICSGLPVAIGHFKQSEDRQPEVALSSRTYVAWFLFAIAREPSTSPEMTIWVMRQLAYMADVAGIQQARTLMHLAGTGREIGDWAKLSQATAISVSSK